MSIGRNEPCPCGSGKKYKKCCLGKQSGNSAPENMQDIMAEVQEKLQSGQFFSLEEAQAELNKIMQRKNTAPLAEFHGLSPTQMHRFLHFPCDSPELAKFANTMESALDIPVIRLFSLLVDAIGDKGLKPTAKGNLPQRFCREAALAFWGEEKYERRIRYGSIRTETDFFDLHCLRLVAGLAGLVRKYKGKFILTQKCRKKITFQGIGAVYPDLFMAYVNKFNWAYRDGYEDIGFIQQSFLFTLYLLHKYGGKTRLHTFYEDIFIKAFPQLPGEVPETPYMSSEETVRRAYVARALDNFASFFGLIEFIPTSEDFRERQYEVKKLPRLDQFIFFTV